LFESALSVVDEVSEPAWKERAMHFIAMELAGAGKLEQAESLVKKMVGNDYKERVEVRICEHLAKEKSFDEALERAGKITDAYRKSEVTRLIHRIRDSAPSPLEQLSGAQRDRVRILTAFSVDGAYDSAILAIVAAKAGHEDIAMKHIRQTIGDSKSFEIPITKIPAAILVSVAFVELGDKVAAGDLVLKLYGSVGNDWSGLSSAFGTPILMSLLARLERFDAMDDILRRERERFLSDPMESWYLSTLESMAASLVEEGHIAEFELRLARALTSEERLYLLMGALIGAEYAKRAKS
jgi:hypothetical protein